MAALGTELCKRGHRVTMIQVPDVWPAAQRAGLEFCVVGNSQYPVGTLRRLDEQLSSRSGLAGLKYSIGRVVQQSETFLREVPAALKRTGVDGLIIDQVEAYGSTIAEYLGLPFVNIAIALPVAPDEFVPPYFTGWKYRTDVIGRIRNRLGYRRYSHLIRPILELVNRQRSEWGLPSFRDRGSRRARLAEIAQLPACLDFPRIALPRFHYTGPFGVSAARPKVEFPWEKLDGRSLVYASMGTVMARANVLQSIAGACSGLNVQLVLSLGGGFLSEEELGSLPGDPVVVRFAPQMELVRRAALVITHAGLNTVLESLSCGVPMVALPFNNDQPGVAARVAWLGAGEVVSGRGLLGSARNLRSAVRRVLSIPSYKESALRLQESIRAIDGPSLASDLIEHAFHANRFDARASRLPGLSPVFETSLS